MCSSDFTMYNAQWAMTWVLKRKYETFLHIIVLLNAEFLKYPGGFQRVHL